MNKILLIDANYLGHRARYTTGPLSYKGRPTGVIFGFLNQLFTLAKKTVPDEVVFVWDSRRSLRKEAYSFYKNKSKTHNDEGPDRELLDAFKQFQELKRDILPQLGFANNFVQSGYEADDIIASIVQQDKGNFTVATSDNDLLQLLDHCQIYNLGKDKYITRQNFVEDYGIRPIQWAEVKKIAGCSSDNVPGVQGVGEKTAIKYLREGLSTKTKTYTTIRSSSDIIERNEWLVKLPLPGVEIPTIDTSDFDVLEMQKLCNSMGFSRMKNQLDDWRLLFRKE